MAPEQDGKDHNHKVDIYAMGIILLELFKSFNSEMEKAKTLEKIQKIEQLRPGVNFINILGAHFLPIFWCQKLQS